MERSLATTGCIFPHIRSFAQPFPFQILNDTGYQRKSKKIIYQYKMNDSKPSNCSNDNGKLIFHY